MGLLIFGKPITIQGRKFNDLKVQPSKEGVPRPIIFGKARPVVGNVIAAAEPRIVEIRQRQGGKGGGGATTVSEEVYRTYAIRVSEGPVSGVPRVWRNGEIVYNRDSTDPVQIENNTAFLEVAEFFFGEFDQQPSAVLQGAFGVYEVPAYRGTCYMVVDDENLTENGGAIPQYQFEVERCIGSYLTSKPYPRISSESIAVNIANNDLEMYGNEKDGATLAVTAEDFSLLDPVISYLDGDPEGANLSVTPESFVLTDIVVAYSDGNPEGLGLAVHPNNLTLTNIVVAYLDGDPEGATISMIPNNFSLFT